MQILMFEDLSLHYIRDGSHQWTLEQSITKIVKVEIFDKTVIPKSDEEDSMVRSLTYLRQMDQEITMAEVPMRMMKRYVENLKFFLQTFVSLLQNDDLSSITADS